jgi:glycosyltransferase involved in cell wall biosynthesis
MLVSVPVATYNSADYVIETLESIYNQTYPEIELIISDDFSTDGTIEKVDEWISQERVRQRFANIQFLKVPHNTGISANCNRYIKASQSDWVKMIAGDDILLPNCIADNMEFVSENPDAQIVFSQIRLYQSTFDEKNFIKTIPKTFPDALMDPSFTPQDQYKILLLGDRIYYTPSFLMHKKAIAKVGGYDEANRLVEDYPMWLKLTSAGIRLHYFHKETVGYRVHPKATNNSGQDVLIKPSQFNNYLIRKEYAHPHLPKLIVLDESWVYHISVLFRKIGITRKTKFNSNLYKLMTVYLNPFFYGKAISKKIS